MEVTAFAEKWVNLQIRHIKWHNCPLNTQVCAGWAPAFNAWIWSRITSLSLARFDRINMIYFAVYVLISPGRTAASLCWTKALWDGKSSLLLEEGLYFKIRFLSILVFEIPACWMYYVPFMFLYSIISHLQDRWKGNLKLAFPTKTMLCQWRGSDWPQWDAGAELWGASHKSHEIIITKKAPTLNVFKQTGEKWFLHNNSMWI